jgi:hypothetical protein
VQRKTKWILGGALAAAVVGAGTGTGLAATSGDDDKPLTGSTLDRAVVAAVDATGGGTVTETEVGDDGASSSVEILLQDGRQVEVDLDREFRVTGQEADDDGPDDDGPDDDGPDDDLDDDGPDDDLDDGPDDD